MHIFSSDLPVDNNGQDEQFFYLISISILIYQL